MTEKKQKRYPTDRLKLHALLEKKEKELVRLREEVEDIRKLVQQADATAINATAAQYNVSPEQLAEIMKKLYGDKSKPVPELPQSVTDAGRQPAEKEESDMQYTAEELIRRFGLVPHVEGGAFRELYRDSAVRTGERPAHGVIYYLLGEDEMSDFHVLDADEYWLWHAGPDVELWSYGADGVLRVERLGLGEGAQPCVLMKAGVTFGARPVPGAKGAMLCSCVCVPEFMYEHYRILSKAEVLRACPEAAGFFA